MKRLRALVEDNLPVPDERLTTLLVEKHRLIAPRLRTALLYRPASMPMTHTVVENLMREGLVTLTSHFEEGTTDVVIQSASSPASQARIREMAAGGTIVIALAIEEDSNVFADVPNIFTFTGNYHNAFELECFVRSVLFRIRDRLYCGPPN